MKRNLNIDILKVLCMYMIVVIHFFTHGLYNELHPIPIGNLFAGVVGLNYFLSELCLLISSVAVNCFVMITGFFLIRKSPRGNRIFSLWVEVFFYSITIAVVFYLLIPSQEHLRAIIKALTPIRNMEYWFATKYLALMALAPFLRRLVQFISKKEYILLLVVMGFLNLNFVSTPALLRNFPYGDIYGGPDSLLWFVFLFLFSGFVSLYKEELFCRKYLFKFKYYIFVVIAFFFWTITLEFLMAIQSGFIGSMGYQYNGLEFMVSVALFLYFVTAKLRVNSNILRKISKWVPYTFAVYLIHDHPCMDNLIWHSYIDWNHIFSSYYFLPFMFCYTLIIFFICIIIDYFRKSIFSFMRIDLLICRISSLLENKLLGMLYGRKG